MQIFTDIPVIFSNEFADKKPVAAPTTPNKAPPIIALPI